MVLPSTDPPQASTTLFDHCLLAPGIDLHDRLDDADRRAELLRGAHQRHGVLGKARAAITWSSVEELLADAAVEADAARHVLHIRAGLLAKIGHLVDEGDLGREEGVGCVFDEFRGAAAGEDDRRLVEEERAIERAHDLAGAFVLDADDDAVRPLEVVDGRAFAQEFRVRGDREIAVGPDAADDRLDLVGGADGDRRFGDDDRVTGHGLGDVLGGGVDIGEIGMAVAASRGRADGDRAGRITSRPGSARNVPPARRSSEPAASSGASSGTWLRSAGAARPTRPPTSPRKSSWPSPTSAASGSGAPRDDCAGRSEGRGRATDALGDRDAVLRGRCRRPLGVRRARDDPIPRSGRAGCPR